MLKTMNEEDKKMSTEIILHEATAVLQAALHHASELSEVGVTDDEFLLMCVLITSVAAHSYTSLGKNIDLHDEVHKLKNLKDVIVRTAEKRFGQTNKVLDEFRYVA
jgi:hypothetical protein